MEKLIIFGCLYSFEDRGGSHEIVHICEYMQADSGKTFKQKVSDKLAEEISQAGLQVGDLVTGSFGLNEFNRVVLTGVTVK